MNLEKAMMYLFSVLLGIVVAYRLSKECLNEPCIINVS